MDSLTADFDINNISSINQSDMDSTPNRSLITSRIIQPVDHSVLEDLDVRPLSSLKSSFIDQNSGVESQNVTVEETTEPHAMTSLLTSSDPLPRARPQTHYPQSLTNLSVINEQSMIDADDPLDQTIIEDPNQEAPLILDELNIPPPPHTFVDMERRSFIMTRTHSNDVGSHEADNAWDSEDEEIRQRCGKACSVFFN